MTTRAIILIWFLCPMAFEASRMTGRRCFKSSGGWFECFAFVKRDGRIRALIGNVTGRAIQIAMVAMVVRIVTWKLEFHFLLALFWKRTEFARRQARA